MKNVLLLLLGIWLSVPASAQELAGFYRSKEFASDTTNILEWINQAAYLRGQNPDSAHKLLNNALLRSKEGNYYPGMILSYVGLAFNHFNNHAFQIGKQYID